MKNPILPQENSSLELLSITLEKNLSGRHLNLACLNLCPSNKRHLSGKQSQSVFLSNFLVVDVFRKLNTLCQHFSLTDFPPFNM